MTGPAPFLEAPHVREALKLERTIEVLKRGGYELIGLQLRRPNGLIETMDLNLVDAMLAADERVDDR
jgi:hypothetical protein